MLLPQQQRVVASAPVPQDGERLFWGDLAHVFLPDSPVTEAADLIGREETVQRLLTKLAGDPMAVPVLVGPPGIGKTSVLNIVRSALQGFDEVLDELQLGNFRPAPHNRLIVTLSCSPSIADKDELSRRVLRWLRHSADAAPTQRRYKVREFSAEANLGLASLKATLDAVEKPDAGSSEQLVRLLESYASEQEADVIVVLDECEQLPWLEELFGYLRSFDAAGVRFMLAMRDHAEERLRSGPDGDYRWPSDVVVKRWGEQDVRAFFDRAADKLAEDHIRWIPDPTVVSRILRLSAGEPWYCQMIGSEILEAQADSLLSTVNDSDEAILRVTANELNSAEQALIDSRLRGTYAQLYTSVAARAPRREEVLRCLARFPETLIPRPSCLLSQSEPLAQCAKLLRS